MAERDLETHGFFLLPLLQRDFHVLDAGCGPGTISMGIAEAVFPGTVTALDHSPEHLEYGQRLAQGREIVNIRFVHGCASALPFADASFDIVFANALLEHMENPQKALHEFYRVTRPGGFTAICCLDWDELMSKEYPFEIREALTACRTIQEGQAGHSMTGTRLKSEMETAGFTPIACDKWQETGENSPRAIECFIKQLEAEGLQKHAACLRAWLAFPDAQLQLAWGYTVGMRTH